MKSSHNGRSGQAANSQVHPRSLLPGLVGKGCHGKERKWEVEDVCRLHGFK